MHEKLRMRGSFSKRQFNLFATSEDQLLDSELEPDVSEEGSPEPLVEDFFADVSNVQAEGGGGRPGLVSFYNRPYRREDELIVYNGGKNDSTLLWVIGPAVLIASFIVPSLYLRRIISTIFEDSLLTGRWNFMLAAFNTYPFRYYGGSVISISLCMTSTPFSLHPILVIVIVIIMYITI